MSENSTKEYNRKVHNPKKGQAMRDNRVYLYLFSLLDYVCNPIKIIIFVIL